MLIKAVQTINPSFQACQIRGNLLELSLLLSHFAGAAKTYYKTLSQGESLERRSKADTRKKARRQKGRLMRVSNKSPCFNPLTRKGQYTGHFTKCTENAKASILAATTRNQTNSHSFNLARPRIKVFIYYYSPLNSV